MNFTASDKKLRNDSLVLTYKASSKKEMTKHLGIESKVEKSAITNADYVRWTGKKVELEIPIIRRDQPDKKVRVPKAYWIPATHPEIIQKLKLHGIKMQILDTPKEIELTMYRISNPEFDRRPVQGRFTVRGNVTQEIRKETFYPGSARVETNQDLGTLIPFLLEPESPDSFFQWGFFLEIFDRIEYVEEYVLEPLVQHMLKDPQVKEEFERKKKEDEKFSSDARAMYDWFYRRSPYADSRFLLYPVGLEY